MGVVVGVGVAPPPNHPPTSLAGGSTPGPVDSVASLLRVCVTSSEYGNVFSPGPGGRRRYIGDIEGSIPLPGPPRWGSRPPRALRGIGLRRSRPARAVRCKRAVAAAAAAVAAAAAAPTDDARGGALARPTSLCAAHAASSRASFVSISPPSRARRSLAWSHSRSHARSRRAVTVAAAATAAAPDDARDGVCNEARARPTNRTCSAPPRASLLVSISSPSHVRRSVACSLSRARRRGRLSRRRRRRPRCRLIMRAVMRAHG